MSLKKILLVHNYYQQWGGEDAVFEMERDLLRHYGHDVETLTFHNDSIASSVSKLKTAVNLFHNLSSAKQLDEKLRAHKPDVIHVHNFFPVASPSMMSIAKKYSVPVVMTLHNFRLICANALLFREGKPCEDCLSQTFPLKGITRACYRDSRLETLALTAMTSLHKTLGTWRHGIDRYIALNHFSKQKILTSSLQLNPEQVVVKPNFIFDPYGDTSPDVDQFKGENKDNFVLFVGRLSIEKGIKTLLNAFQNDPSLPLLKIVGSGPLEPDVREFVSTHSNVEYLGFQERPVILEFMKKAKALILPSTCYENFPMTIVEALACGTPVVTSKNGGLPDIIQDGYNGFLASVGDPSDLQVKIKQIAQVDYPTLCHNARKSYIERYSPSQNYQQLMEIYASIR